ncbi:MAG: tetratricopeptide repeat protein [Nevskiales bacterium]|nr:tetratricopeptide repeat protein [Nevskiales bacterium]
MPSFFPTPLFRCLAVVGLWVCTLTAAGAKDPVFNSPQAAAQYHVMTGQLAALREQPELAAEQFLKALDYAPAADLAMRATALALAAQNEILALQAARRWQALDESDGAAREALARLALRTGERGEAQAQCEALVRGHAGGPEEGFRQVALLLSQENDRSEDALTIMGNLQRQWPNLPGALYAQGLLALRFSRLDLAEQATREALRLAPAARDSALLLAAVLVKKGDIAAADSVLAGLIEDSDNPAELHLGYARLLLDADRLEDARVQLEAALAEKPDYLEARYSLGLLALRREDLEAAESQFHALLTSDVLRQTAAYYLGRIEEIRQRPAQALAWYAQITDGELAIDALIRRSAMLGQLGRLDEGRRLLTELRQERPEFSVRFYLAEGELLLNADAGEQALALYQQALDVLPGHADLLYGRSLAYERLKKLSQAEADLRRILKTNPDDARAMNALGYMLTVHSSRLDEAHRLIARALELSPDDAAVIDSMGWVEFRRGELKKAHRLLEKAFNKEKDPEIAAHFGEVLWRLGEKDRARAVWDAALVHDPEHPVLKETVERLSK